MVIALLCVGVLIALCVYRMHIFHRYFNVPDEPEIRAVYYCIKNPPCIGCVPFFGMIESVDYGEKRYIAEIDRMAWGRVIYNRELGYHEVSDFGLIHEPRE